MDDQQNDEMNDEYPVQYSVDYKDGVRNRLTTLFRLIMVIPIAIVAGLIGSTGYTIFYGAGEADTTSNTYIPTITLGILLLILFRKKYPRWVFNFLLEVSRLTARVGAYASLLVDQYPSSDEEQSVHLNIDYPDVEADLKRWMPLVKWLLAIPHYIVLLFLGIAVFIVTIIAWFAIIITGKYPEAIFNFVVGVYRWAYRVVAYAFLLTTDRYPPFSLN